VIRQFTKNDYTKSFVNHQEKLDCYEKPLKNEVCITLILPSKYVLEIEVDEMNKYEYREDFDEDLISESNIIFLLETLWIEY